MSKYPKTLRLSDVMGSAFVFSYILDPKLEGLGYGGNPLLSFRGIVSVPLVPYGDLKTIELPFYSNL